MIGTIRYTLFRVFDLYLLQARRYASFWPLYLFVALLVSAALAALVCLVAVKVYHLRSYDSTLLRQLDLVSDPGLLRHWTDILSRMAVFFMAVFAAFTPAWDDAAPERITLKDVRNTLVARHAGALARMSGSLCVIEVLLFREPFRMSAYGDAIWDGSIINEDVSEVGMAVMAWVNALVDQVRAFVPYVLGLLFLARTWKISVGTVIKEYRRAFWAVLVLAFCLGAIQSDLLGLINTFVWPLLLAPFSGPAIPSVLGMALILFLFSWTVPAYAGIVRAPLEYALVQEAQQPGPLDQAGEWTQGRSDPGIT